MSSTNSEWNKRRDRIRERILEEEKWDAIGKCDDNSVSDDEHRESNTKDGPRMWAVLIGLMLAGWFLLSWYSNLSGDERGFVIAICIIAFMFNICIFSIVKVVDAIGISGTDLAFTLICGLILSLGGSIVVAAYLINAPLFVEYFINGIGCAFMFIVGVLSALFVAIRLYGIAKCVCY